MKPIQTTFSFEEKGTAPQKSRELTKNLHSKNRPSLVDLSVIRNTLIDYIMIHSKRSDLF